MEYPSILCVQLNKQVCEWWLVGPDEIKYYLTITYTRLQRERVAHRFVALEVNYNKLY